MEAGKKMESPAKEIDKKLNINQLDIHSAPPSGLLGRKPSFQEVDFGRSPFLAIWEVTQACDLACLHCRAEARPCRDAGELSTEEGLRLLDDVRQFGPVLFVLTGGDPLKRPDIFDLIRHGTGIGLRMTMTPSGTQLLTRERVCQMREAGLARVAVSVDGPDRMSHDLFRAVPGSFQWTMDCVRWAREEGLEVQINSTVTRFNKDRLREMAGMVARLGITLWSVFFLVPVGRGSKHHMVRPAEHEALFHQLYDLSKEMPFDIKTTAAQHFRRVCMQRAAWDRLQGISPIPGGAAASFRGGPGFSAGIGRAAKGVNDGNGLVFISHRGEVMPSGFLPVSAGNVRERSVVDLYRDSGLFRSLRQPDSYAGKCGYCDFRDVCGGSRARAFATAGDSLGSEPFCTYRPAKPGSQRSASNTFKGKYAAAGALSRPQVMEALAAGNMSGRA